MRTDARDIEKTMLERCRQIATTPVDAPQNQAEANVCRVAGMIVRIRYPDAGARLLAAADTYFTEHPEDKLPPEEVVRRGWVISLPRLRDQLERLLAAFMHDIQVSFLRAETQRNEEAKIALQVLLQLDGREIVATFEDGRIIRHGDALTLAALLWAAGVRADNVQIVDWHDDPKRALSGGQKVAIFGYLRQQQMIQDGTILPASVQESLLYKLTDYPVLAALARKRTTATRLDGRTCRFLYTEALPEIDISKLSESEKKLFDALGVIANSSP